MKTALTAKAWSRQTGPKWAKRPLAMQMTLVEEERRNHPPVVAATVPAQVTAAVPAQVAAVVLAQVVAVA